MGFAMIALKVFLKRLIATFQRRDLGIDEEIQTHLELLAEEHSKRGMEPNAARRAAQRAFGGATQTKEAYRDYLGFPLIDSLLQDLRFAVRGLRNSPTFASTVILTLALGIGTNTAMFSLLDAVLLKPLPFRDSDRLVEIWGRDALRTGLRVPVALVEQIRERSTALQEIAIHGPEGGELRTANGPVRILGRRVSANYFDVLGVQPIVGRTLVAADEDGAASPVMVVSHGFWQERMGGDLSAVGRSIYLGRTPFTVVGIMPADFRTSFRLRPEEFWTPHVRGQIRQIEEQVGLELVGRLAAGNSIAEARRELQAIAATIQLDGWGMNGRQIDLVPLVDEIVGDSAFVLQLVTGATAVFLLIVCLNVALLTFARSDRRFVEFATRKAIGATGPQLIRFALIESIVLSTIGGIAGIGLSYWLLPVLRTLAPSEIPRLSEATLDKQVLLVAAVLSVLTGIASGLVPALRVSRFSITDAIKRGTGATPRHRVRFHSALVVTQIATTVVLLVLAGLIGRTFLTLLPSNPGFDPRFRAVFPFILPPASREERIRALDQLAERLQTIPGMQGAALGSNVPFGGDDGFRRIRPLDGPGGQDLRADLRAITEDYFQVLKMPLTAGRVFTPSDRTAVVGAAVVNQTFARKFGGDIIGRHVRIESGQAPLQSYEIVGVVGDARSSGSTTGPWDEIYIPVRQSNPSIVFAIVWSTTEDFAVLEAAVRRELRAALPDRVDDPVVKLTPLAALVHQSLARPRFSAMVITAFSASALALTAIGVFALIAYGVAQRRPELGLRAALGADTQTLLFMILNSTAVLVGVGVAVGLGGAMYATRFIVSQLYGVKPLDLPTLVGAAVVMAAVAGAAAYLPARRASRVDPMVALRCE
jgi:putative ABC transport system permease protein